MPNRRQVGVVVAGELDSSTARAVPEAVGELVAAGFEGIVLDLRRVAFIDSAGLRMLIALRNDAERTERRLSLIPAQPAAQRIFRVTGTHGLFDWRERFPGSVPWPHWTGRHAPGFGPSTRAQADQRTGRVAA